MNGLGRFLGMLNFYMNFIKHAAEIQAPLNQILRGVKTKVDCRSYRSVRMLNVAYAREAKFAARIIYGRMRSYDDSYTATEHK